MNVSFQNHRKFGRDQRNLLLISIQIRAPWAVFVNKIFKHMYLSPNYFVLLPLQYMFFASIYKRQMALSMANLLHVLLNKEIYACNWFSFWVFS